VSGREKHTVEFSRDERDDLDDASMALNELANNDLASSFPEQLLHQFARTCLRLVERWDAEGEP